MRVKGRALVIILLALSIISCGYTIASRASLSIDSIKIGKIINKTSEPSLQDMLNIALVDEFQRRGVKVTDSSDNIIDADIISYKLDLLSEKKELGLEYQTNIKVDFRVRCNGEDREYRGVTSPSIDYFAGQSALNSTAAHKQLSDKQAMDGIAFFIVTQLALNSPK
ncbi:MAG: hypothetical protein HQK91_05260 [Nitrospirae bacterium]|nr:hypothetical protein [Nitrospirota bacterium]